MKRKNLSAVLTLFLGAVVIGALWPSPTTAQTPGTVFKDCPECPEMVVIPAGSFRMGSPPGEEKRYGDEGPVRRVTIPRPFAVGKYEVTQAEWRSVMGSNPSMFKGDRNPVEEVSWDDAQDFVRRLGAKTGKQYRLLTEAEWEYAARAGTTTLFHFGATISTDQANYNGNYTYGGGRKGVYRKKTVPVGSFPANAFGLHDMHGNVYEWVEDCWHAVTSSSTGAGGYNGAPSNGSAWTSGGDCRLRVLRGGSWNYTPRYLRSALRNWSASDVRNNYIGFRVARTLSR
ncbi:MAG: formylglycine-generating enzyme family protein [Kiritimatiellia bacterium]|nr:formylglycine-generating enzyme family protein [Kiritimatiellia bacterium]